MKVTSTIYSIKSFAIKEGTTKQIANALKTIAESKVSKRSNFFISDQITPSLSVEQFGDGGNGKADMQIFQIRPDILCEFAKREYDGLRQKLENELITFFRENSNTLNSKTNAKRRTYTFNNERKILSVLFQQNVEKDFCLESKANPFSERPLSNHQINQIKTLFAKPKIAELKHGSTCATLLNDLKNLSSLLQAIDRIKKSKESEESICATVILGRLGIIGVIAEFETKEKIVATSRIAQEETKKRIEKTSEKINQECNHLNSIFEAMDFRRLITQGNKFDPPEAPQCALDEGTYIYNHIFAIIESESQNIDEESADEETYFHYLSLCLAYQRNENYRKLYKLAQKSIGGVTGWTIKPRDYNESSQTHLFYSDGKFVHTVWNQLSKTGKGPNRGNHNARYKGRYLSEATVTSIAYSTMCISAYNICELKTAQLFKAPNNRLSKIHKLTKELSRVRLIYNSEPIYFKPMQRTNYKVVSKCLDIDNFENKSTENTQNLWQEANISASKFSTYLGVMTSIFSLIAAAFVTTLAGLTIGKEFEISLLWENSLNLVALILALIAVLVTIALGIIDLIYWLKPTNRRK